MNRAKFFAGVRASVFGGALSQQQVEGMEAVLDDAGAMKVNDPRHVAYILATPMIETGGSFRPIVENLNYSTAALTTKFGSRISTEDARRFGRNDNHPADQRQIANRIYGGQWGKQNLGNTQPDDGWDMRGRGLCQMTGRRNYELFGARLGIDLAGNPDLASELPTASKIMVIGMRDGLFTGKKLGDYFTSSSSDWTNARRTVNSLDRAAEIASFGRRIYAALLDAA
jgi:putative chitinase